MTPTSHLFHLMPSWSVEDSLQAANGLRSVAEDYEPPANVMHTEAEREQMRDLMRGAMRVAAAVLDDWISFLRSLEYEAGEEGAIVGSDDDTEDDL